MSDATNIAGFEELVRTHAYALWENEGRPFGRHAEHWLLSEQAMRAEVARPTLAKSAETAKSKPAPRKKAVSKRPTSVIEMSTRH